MHPVNGTDDVFTPRTDCPGIIHLIHANRRGSLADNAGDLAVGKKVALTPGADTKFPHFHTGRIEREKISGQTSGIFHFGNNSPGKRGCKGRIHGFIRADDIDKIFLYCCFATAPRKFFTGIFLNIHASLYVGGT